MGGVCAPREGVKGFAPSASYESSDTCPAQAQWTIRVCKGGIAARGAVFVMRGLFFLLAARHSNPNEARGLDGTLAVLARQQYGDVLLTVVAAGLVAYAVYMAVISRYRRFLGA